MMTTVTQVELACDVCGEPNHKEVRRLEILSQ